MSKKRLVLDDEFDRLIEQDLSNWLTDSFEIQDFSEELDQLRSGAHQPRETDFDIGPIGEVAKSVIPESIVMIFKRPSIIVRKSDFEIPQSPTWAKVLEKSRSALHPILPAVGRIEVDNHPRLHAVGSAFLIDDGVVVTNRHVAMEFIEQQGDDFRFAISSRGREITACIDFKEEDTRPVQEDEHRLKDILYVADANGPDLALFSCPSAQQRPGLTLTDDLVQHEAVAAIGYPFEDGRLRRDLKDAADRIFGDIYEVKRLAPGKVKKVDATSIDHDCTTLHGNSGSVIVKLATGEAVGVHHGGGIAANHAVAAREVLKALETITG